MDTTCQVRSVVDGALFLFVEFHVMAVSQRSTAADPRDAFGDG